MAAHLSAGALGSEPWGSGLAFSLAALVALGTSFLLVRRIERIADRLHLSEALLGLLVALAADSPEITSAVTASVRGQQRIGAGVVLGSNVFNLAALLGLGAVVASGIALHRRVVLLEGTTAIWLAVVAVAVVWAGLGPGPGLVLALLVVVPYVLVAESSRAGLRRFPLPDRTLGWLTGAVHEEEVELAEAFHDPRNGGRLDVLVAALALVAVVGASTVMERSAESVGRHFHLSDLVVGAVLLAAVTSLPNAVGGVVLARRGRGAALLSEAMNSNMINVIVGLLVPGIVAGVGRSGDSTFVAAWYCGLTVLSLAMAYSTTGLSRRQGLAIVAAYLAFVVLAVA